MRRLIHLLAAGFLLAGPTVYAQSAGPSAPSTAAVAPSSVPDSPEELERMMLRVLDFPYDHGSERKKFDWKIGTYFTGITAAHQATGNPRFLKAATDWSKAREWKLKGTPLFADNLTMGQTYLYLYLQARDPVKIADTRAKLEVYFERDVIKKKDFYTKWKDAERPFTGRNVWWWCDALYMAPPLFLQMRAATGEDRYLDTLDRFYWDVIDHLYDREEQLVIRDLDYIGKKSPGGKKIFWSRGNGWVYAGLVHILDLLPENAARRDDYLKLYREMTASILKYQGNDGLWRSALNEPEWYPEKEASGSAFFCFGLLAGVNRGWLPAEGHLAPALKAWAGLKGCLDENGWLGHAQIEAENPGKVATHAHLDYAQGAFLLAAAEAYKHAVAEFKTKPAAGAGNEKPSTWCRLVPERLDDFAWENDLVAFRAYGPAARAAGGKENSGIDVWLKRVRYPVIEKWYAGYLAGRSYHKDTGEGYDPYHVGRSRGCGGLAIWHDSQMVLSGPFLGSKLIKRETAESIFELTYEYKLDERIIREVKRITVKLGSRLVEIESRFSEGGKPVVLDIAIGVTTHDGKAVVTLNAKKGWIACWERIDGQGLGTGVVIAPDKILRVDEVKSEKPDEGHAIVLTRTDTEGVVRYRAGYGWERAGDITTSEQWQGYLSQAAR